MAAPPEMNRDIRKFEEIGTHPAANHNAIAEALTFHEGIGIERKAARLRYLKERWARRLEKQKGVRILTSFCYSRDRKSTRLNSSHSSISYAVFCLKKKT